MKKKTSICVALLLTSIACAACGAEQSTPVNTQTENQLVVPSENPTPDAPALSFDASQNIAYNSEKMSLAYSYEGFQGQIKDILPRRGECYLYTSEGIFKDADKLFVPSQPITEFNVLSTTTVDSNIIITHNESGTYSIYVEQMDVESGSTVQEIISDLTYEPIFAWYVDFLNEITLFSQGENGYYANYFILDAEKNLWTNTQTWPIQARSDNFEVFSEDIIQLLPEHYLLLSDNTLHFTSNYSSGNEYQNYATVDAKSVHIPNVLRIIPPNSDFLYNKPLFEAVGDNSNLYLYNADIKYAEYDEQHRVCIPLPTGYTTDMIHNVLFDDDLLIEFNTGEIFVSKKDSIDCLEMQEEISTLNKEGKIQKLFLNSLHFCVLMDDNCVYVLNLQ